MKCFYRNTFDGGGILLHVYTTISGNCENAPGLDKKAERASTLVQCKVGAKSTVYVRDNCNRNETRDSFSAKAIAAIQITLCSI